MYYSGQIVYDLKTKQPIKIRNAWNPKDYPEEDIHFINIKTKEIAFPRTIKEAKLLLKNRTICPAKFKGHICSVRGRVWWSYKHCEDCNPNATEEGLINGKDYKD